MPDGAADDALAADAGTQKVEKPAGMRYPASVEQLHDGDGTMGAGGHVAFVRLQWLFEKNPMHRAFKQPKTTENIMQSKLRLMQAHPLPSVAVGTNQMNVIISMHDCRTVNR